MAFEVHESHDWDSLKRCCDACGCTQQREAERPCPDYVELQPLMTAAEARAIAKRLEAGEEHTDAATLPETWVGVQRQPTRPTDQRPAGPPSAQQNRPQLKQPKASAGQSPRGDNGGSKGGRGSATSTSDLGIRRPNGQFGPGNRLGTKSKPPKGGCSRERSLIERALTQKDGRRAVVRLNRILEGDDDRLALEAFKLLYGPPAPPVKANGPEQRQASRLQMPISIPETPPSPHPSG